MATGKLYVVGSANMDLVVRAPRLPASGETVVGSDLVRVPGGKGANQAVAAARLGVPVGFAGCVGDDAFGQELRQALLADGVDTSTLKVVADRPSGVALIVVDDRGENLIAVSPGANAALQPEDVMVALQSIGSQDVLLVQLEVQLAAVFEACRVARTAGARVIINAAPADQRIGERLDLASVLIVNAGEAQALGGTDDPRSAATELLKRGPSLVVVTLGELGVLIAGDSGAVMVPALPVNVVDTTAAGDAFCGAFAAALLEGRTPREAAAFATAAAGLSTTRFGAQSSLPTRAEVERVLVGAPR